MILTSKPTGKAPAAAFLDVSELRACLRAHQGIFDASLTVVLAHAKAWQASCWDWRYPHGGTYYGIPREDGVEDLLATSQDLRDTIARWANCELLHEFNEHYMG